jgi:hypothetical protein
VLLLEAAIEALLSALSAPRIPSPAELRQQHHAAAAEQYAGIQWQHKCSAVKGSIHQQQS